MKPFGELLRYKAFHPTMGWGNKEGGYFAVFSPVQAGKKLRIIASTGMGWDHVSVSLPHRIPTWKEMDYIKRLFFNPDEVVMQIHPAESKHVNNMEFCLHLWRPQNENIPLPPLELI